jgi:hypothetical protein
MNEKKEKYKGNKENMKGKRRLYPDPLVSHRRI